MDICDAHDLPKTAASTMAFCFPLYSECPKAAQHISFSSYKTSSSRVLFFRTLARHKHRYTVERPFGSLVTIDYLIWLPSQFLRFNFGISTTKVRIRHRRRSFEERGRLV